MIVDPPYGAYQNNAEQRKRPPDGKAKAKVEKRLEKNIDKLGITKSKKRIFLLVRTFQSIKNQIVFGAVIILNKPSIGLIGIKMQRIVLQTVN